MILGSIKHVWGMRLGGGGRGWGYPHSGSRVSYFILEHIRKTCFVYGCFELGFLQFIGEFS
jgi:hypothetical protein